MTWQLQSPFVLLVQMTQVLEVIIFNLMQLFNARSEAHLMTRLKEGRGRTYQLGKSNM